LESMASQTRPPVRWVVVSDGSDDGTDEVVAEYAARFSWIHLVRLPPHTERNFAAKVHAFNAGFATASNLRYDIICCMDADISFEADYFEFLLAQFSKNAKLGVAGTPFVDGGMQYNYTFTNIEHVSGACQLFRRECFEQIGGYVPLKGGGIDWVAVTSARMKGWQTRTFTERTSIHHRPMGTGAAGPLRALFRHGRKDYSLGGHPVWQLCRSFYQLWRPPYIVGGALLAAGYFSAFLVRAERVVPLDLMQFSRSEQISRLRRLLLRPFGAAR
jgi:glycosyltransferase involved in cell wall biosynthesis